MAWAVVVVPACVGPVEGTRCMAQSGHDGLPALTQEGQMLVDRHLVSEEWADSKGPNRASYKGCIRVVVRRVAEMARGGATTPVVEGMYHRRFDAVDTVVLERYDCAVEV